MTEKLYKLASYFERLAATQSSMWWSDPVPVQGKGASLPQSFWVKFVQMSQRLGVSPYDIAAVINMESGFDPAARNFAAGKNKPPVAQGLNQLIRSTAKTLGISDHLWQNFVKLPAEEQLKWTEKYFNMAGARGKNAGQLYLANFGGFNNPDGSLYAGHAAQQRWVAAHPEDKGKFRNPAYQQKAIEQNQALVTNGRIMPGSVTKLVSRGIGGPIRSRIDEALRAVGNSEPPAFEDPSGEWAQQSVQQSIQQPVQQSVQQPGSEGLLEQESEQLLRNLWQ